MPRDDDETREVPAKRRPIQEMITLDRVLQTVGGILLAVIGWLCLSVVGRVERVEDTQADTIGRVIRLEANGVSEADKLKAIGERMDKGFGDMKADLKELGAKVDRAMERRP